MKIPNFIKRRKNRPIVTPEDVINKINSKMEPPDVPNYIKEINRHLQVQLESLLDPLEQLFGPAARSAHEAEMRSMAAQQRLSPLQAMGMVAPPCFGMCQPHRADPTITNTVSPRRKHIDCEVYDAEPQKLLPEGEL
jgi:hypothetical protein